MNTSISELNTLLRSMQPELIPGVYAIVSVSNREALGNAEVVATMREPEGLSAVIADADAARLNLPILFRAAWITLTVQSDLQAVGLTAAFSAALGEAGIPCNVVAGAWHDHLFVPVERAEDALAALRRLQRSAAVAAAARNNAAWYGAMFRAHGLPDELSPSVWLSRAQPPPYHSNLVVISDAPNDALTHIRALMALPLSPGWTLKDSFYTLELGALGFEVLFEATWIWCEPRPHGASPAMGWTRIKSPAELLAWEEGWLGDAGNADAHGRPAQFPPSLLADPGVAFFACHRGQELVAGGIANRAAGVVGLSNVFVASAEPRAVWAGLIDAALAAFPGLPLVGYQRGAALDAAMACGFGPIGPLRVWMRRVAPTSP
jgi:hypothetical protein